MNQTVNKKTLIRQVAARSGLDVARAAKVVETVLAIIVEQIGQGETVNISGFGAFGTYDRQGRRGSHPRTHQPMDIPPSKMPVFRPSPSFRNRIQ